MQDHRPARFLMELFAGTGTVSRAFLARGWNCIAVDTHPHKSFPNQATLLQRDVRTMRGTDYAGVLDLVWASPPCTDFSWAKHPGMKTTHTPSLQLIEAARDFAHDARAPLIIENVFGAQRWLGPATAHFGKFYLWGDGVPALLPKGPRWKDPGKCLHRSPALRARIPDELAEAVANFHDSRHP